MRKERARPKPLDLGRPQPREINLNPPPCIQRRKPRPVQNHDAPTRPQIERTQSWEWKEAQMNRPTREEACHALPEVVILSPTYFGLPLSNYLPSTKLNCKYVQHEKPFYPPGVTRSPNEEIHKKRVEQARIIYATPKARRILRLRTLSEPPRSSLSSPQLHHDGRENAKTGAVSAVSSYEHKRRDSGYDDDDDDTSVVILKPAWANSIDFSKYVSEVCSKCNQSLGTDDRVKIMNKVFHKSSFQCAVCNCTLSPSERIYHAGAWKCRNHAYSSFHFFP